MWHGIGFLQHQSRLAATPKACAGSTHAFGIAAKLIMKPVLAYMHHRLAFFEEAAGGDLSQE